MKLTLAQALEITQGHLDAGWTSDGCTFFPEMGITRFCQMHDCMLEKNPYGITRWEADVLLFKGINTKGLRYFPVAVIGLVGSRVGAAYRWIERKIK